jgi:hypothetical protein
VSQNYPSYPQGPPPGQYSYSPVERGSTPPPVRWAVGLMVVRAALGIATIVIVFTTKDAIRRRLERDHRDYSASRINTLVNGEVAVTVVFAAIFFVLYLLLAWQVSKGRNWARIVTWVIGGLGVFGALASLAPVASGASRVLGGIVGLFDIAIVVLLIVGGKGGYFRGPSREQYPDAYPPPAYPPPPNQH